MLSSINITKNTALIRLFCNTNQLSSLDVSNNIALVHLYCYGNNLSSLNLSKNTVLGMLLCNNNKLIHLDLSNNTNLNVIYASEQLNFLTVVQGSTLNLKDIDPNFDPTRASNMYISAGMEFNAGVLSNITDGAVLTYDYKTNNRDIIMTVELTFTTPNSSHTPNPNPTNTPSASPVVSNTPVVTSTLAPLVTNTPAITPLITNTPKPVKAPQTGDNTPFVLFSILFATALIGFVYSFKVKNKFK